LHDCFRLLLCNSFLDRPLSSHSQNTFQRGPLSFSGGCLPQPYTSHHVKLADCCLKSKPLFWKQKHCSDTTFEFKLPHWVSTQTKNCGCLCCLITSLTSLTSLVSTQTHLCLLAVIVALGRSPAAAMLKVRSHWRPRDTERLWMPTAAPGGGRQSWGGGGEGFSGKKATATGHLIAKLTGRRTDLF